MGTGSIGTGMGLIGLPLAAAIFSVLISYGPVAVIFSVIGSLAAGAIFIGVAGIASGASISLGDLGSFKFPDIKGWTLRYYFSIITLGALYGSNMALGINLINSIPMSMGLVISGVLTALFVLGMFVIATGE